MTLTEAMTWLCPRCGHVNLSADSSCKNLLPCQGGRSEASQRMMTKHTLAATVSYTRTPWDDSVIETMRRALHTSGMRVAGRTTSKEIEASFHKGWRTFSATDVAGDVIAFCEKKQEQEHIEIEQRDWQAEYYAQAAQATQTEKVNHPRHYNTHPSHVECIAIIEHMTFNAGTAVKYLWRAGLKDETGDTDADRLRDLKKALWYVQREIGRLEGTNPTVADDIERNKTKDKNGVST